MPSAAEHGAMARSLVSPCAGDPFQVAIKFSNLHQKTPQTCYLYLRRFKNLQKCFAYLLCTSGVLALALQRSARPPLVPAATQWTAARGQQRQPRAGALHMLSTQLPA